MLKVFKRNDHPIAMLLATVVARTNATTHQERFLSQWYHLSYILTHSSRHVLESWGDSWLGESVLSRRVVAVAGGVRSGDNAPGNGR